MNEDSLQPITQVHDAVPAEEAPGDQAVSASQPWASSGWGHLPTPTSLGLVIPFKRTILISTVVRLTIRSLPGSPTIEAPINRSVPVDDRLASTVHVARLFPAARLAGNRGRGAADAP